MIYKSSFFSKELKQGYLENSASKRNHIGFGVFLGLMAFSIYFFAETLERSVVKDVAAQLMYESYFSTLYIFINISSICYAIYLIVYYEYLSFIEIIRNRWYTLVKMGYDSTSMIIIKIIGRIISIGVIYTVGFLSTIILTAFLKFPFIIEYMPSLYIAGFIDLILLTIITMIISLIIKNSNTSRYIIMASCLIIFLVKWATGFTAIVADRELMKNVLNLFDIDKSYFILIAIVISTIMMIIGVIRAKNIAKYYNFPYYKNDIGISDDIEIVIVEEDGGEAKKSNDYRLRKENKSINAIFTTILAIVLIVSIFVNGIILLISVSSKDKEVTMFGYIPYIFMAETMEPSIMYNDLVFFKRIDDEKQLNVNDIILYDKSKGEDAQIARVKKIKDDNNLIVDIDKYPEGSDAGGKLETIEKKDIYGVYVDRSRWLGAIILFANSTFGRLLFLIIPTILIFFYKEINDFFNEEFKDVLKE